jgi:hypothetical protein
MTRVAVLSLRLRIFGEVHSHPPLFHRREAGRVFLRAGDLGLVVVGERQIGTGQRLDRDLLGGGINRNEIAFNR